MSENSENGNKFMAIEMNYEEIEKVSDLAHIMKQTKKALQEEEKINRKLEKQEKENNKNKNSGESVNQENEQEEKGKDKGHDINKNDDNENNGKGKGNQGTGN